MDTFSTILSIVFVVVSIVMIVIVLMQEDKSGGLSSAITGAQSSDSYWSKNKSRSAEGKLIKITRYLAILFVVVALVLDILAAA